MKPVFFTRKNHRFLRIFENTLCLELLNKTPAKFKNLALEKQSVEMRTEPLIYIIEIF
ncbi:MAG: hypothetical protein ACD_51C00190G0002 [uncultured bacterium]|nr:MAG: hypothetical protein ACD_51C00190G0002 [uncultured bacterium]